MNEKKNHLTKEWWQINNRIRRSINNYSFFFDSIQLSVVTNTSTTSGSNLARLSSITLPLIVNAYFDVIIIAKNHKDKLRDGRTKEIVYKIFNKMK